MGRVNIPGYFSLLASPQVTQQPVSTSELYNLCWAINSHKGIHSEEYVRAVWERLRDAGGSENAIKEALLEMRRALEDSDFFWLSN